jgi:hypothetical protein
VEVFFHHMPLHIPVPLGRGTWRPRCRAVINNQRIISGFIFFLDLFGRRMGITFLFLIFLSASSLAIFVVAAITVALELDSFAIAALVLRPGLVALLASG